KRTEKKGGALADPASLDRSRRGYERRRAAAAAKARMPPPSRAKVPGSGIAAATPRRFRVKVARNVTAMLAPESEVPVRSWKFPRRFCSSNSGAPFVPTSTKVPVPLMIGPDSSARAPIAETFVLAETAQFQPENDTLID